MSGNVEDSTLRSDTSEEKVIGHDHHDHVADIPDPDAGLSDAERKAIDRKLIWKLDLQLIPWLCLLYLLSFLDRTNIGNAKIDTLTQDLGLSSGAYNAALSVFFVSYSIFEPLTNVLLKRMRPSVFIPIIMIMWGGVMTFMGLVTNWSGLMAARWFLGLAEAGLFPGINYYLSCWYRRDEFGIRAAIFFSAAAVSGSFGGLLAAAITKMNGVGGYHGWQWIFILEGLATVVVGVISFWVVQDFPDNAKFLNPEDRARVVRRLKADQQSSAEHESLKKSFIFAALKDYKMYVGMLIYMGCDMALYAFSLFLPTIVAAMNISTSSTTNQLLTVPPYAVAACMTIFIGWFADRTRWRGYSNIFCSLLAIAGFGMLLGTASPFVQYAGVFLAAMGIYPCIANTISWVSNNIEGVYKRGVVLGCVIGWGNMNGIVSSNIYRNEDKAGGYKPGHSVVMGYLIVCLLGGSILNHILLRRENAKRAAGLRDHWATGLSPKEVEMLGDKRPDFFYTL